MNRSKAAGSRWTPWYHVPMDMRFVSFPVQGNQMKLLCSNSLLTGAGERGGVGGNQRELVQNDGI